MTGIRGRGRPYATSDEAGSSGATFCVFASHASRSAFSVRCTLLWGSVLMYRLRGPTLDLDHRRFRRASILRGSDRIGLYGAAAAKRFVWPYGGIPSRLVLNLGVELCAEQDHDH